MGKMTLIFPEKLLDDLGKSYDKSHELFNEMVKAGQDVIYNNTLKNLPASLKDSNFRNNISKTRIYNTKDGSLNGGVVVSGYFVNDKGKRTPAPLVANMFEYGSNIHHYPKKPFMRKSLKRNEILSAASQAQERYSIGDE